MPALPQSIYDQFGDPSVSVINMPSGTFDLVKWLWLPRSNVVVNYGGCILNCDPVQAQVANSLYPIRVRSIPKGVIFATSPGGNIKRDKSHLLGTVTKATNQLTMAHGEIVDVQVGEEVLVWAGVDKGDPAEAFAFVTATIQAVDYQSGLITFAAPLGIDVPNYGSLDGVRVVTNPSLWRKIGTWGSFPTEENFAKGFGTDHGLERFTGGMVHDVTLNGIDLRLPTMVGVPMAGIPTDSWGVSAIAVNRLKINGLKVDNPLSGASLLWRCFDSEVNDLVVTGQGFTKSSSTVVTGAGAAALWGGKNITYNRVSIHGKDIGVLDTQAGSGGIVMNDLDYDVEFTALRTYKATSLLFAFQSVRDWPKLNNAVLNVGWTGGLRPGYCSFVPMLFDGRVVFGGSSLINYFDLGQSIFPKFDGTLVVGGIEYGPQAMRTETLTIPYNAAVSPVSLQPGLFISSRLRVKEPGKMVALYDSWGRQIWGNTWKNPADWKPFLWNSIEPGDAALKEYTNKKFNAYFNTATPHKPATVEFNYTYLPKK